ncbi:hypothetical protein [Paenibacillus glycinis]|uniref:Uncharacterized protein n=1 Tax=Paenibacillus glycinis TaxID=2697035 RepID=A0ABW9XRW6_9BACL|nr:hypothetical protein [Paenibacillus glycinis]NBD25402.1 hypothetical protein [Paenibacillus glycinis]
MKRILNHLIWGLIIFPFFISMFCLSYFPCWLLFGLYILTIGILSIFGTFSKLEKIKNKVRRIFTRIAFPIVGIGMLVFFCFVWAPGYLDIGNYMTKDYRTVKGFPEHIDHLSSRSLFQGIKVKNISLISVYEIPEQDFDKEIEAVYLPRSKYVIKLGIYR